MLRILLFLLIFGPKLSSTIDVIPLTSLALVGLTVLRPKAFYLPSSAISNAIYFLSGIVILGLYAACHYISAYDPEPYQVLRFCRIILNFFGVLALLGLYVRSYGPAVKQVLARHVFDCLVVHSVIMFSMFISPQFRNLISSSIVLAGDDIGTQEAKEAGSRISGLVLSWDALSGLQSLGLLMIPPMMTREKLSATYATVAVPLLLFAVAISGRTGVVTLALLLPVSLYFTDLRKVNPRVLGTAILLGVLTLLAVGPFYSTLLSAAEGTAIARVLVMFDSDAGTEKQSSDFAVTIDAIKMHYHLPDNPNVLLFGTGRSGRDPLHYVASDNGITLNLHNLGLFSWMLIYGCALRLVWSAWMIRRAEPPVACYAIMSVALILVIDAKVAYLYSRNGFTIMMVLAALAWWDDKTKQSRSETLRASPHTRLSAMTGRGMAERTLRPVLRPAGGGS